MRIGEIIKKIDKKVKKFGNGIWTFDDYKELAKELYTNFGIVSIPATLVPPEKEGGKIQKKPLVKWKEISPKSWEDLDELWEEAVRDKRKKKRKVIDPSALRSFKKETNATAIALLTGKISGITVIDVDDLDKFKTVLKEKGLSSKEINELLKTLITKTPSGGVHFVFKYTNKLKTTTTPYGFDIRNDKGLVIFPPSRVPTEPTPEYTIFRDNQLR